MREPCYIGIDTSNYTTSLAAVNAAGDVLASLKAPLPVKQGERGLRQSDAVFAHTKNLPPLLDALRDAIDGYTPAAVCYSDKPRDEKDSYMPCFLSGAVAAHAVATSCGIPVFTCSHQQGHLMAALFSSGALTSLVGSAFGAFHVSGGTTEMLYVTGEVDHLAVKRVGGSADLHAGQAIDRIGVKMGLRFPCGAALEALALQNTKPIPRPRISVSEGICNLSGLENLAIGLYEKGGDAPLVAAYVFSFLSATLLEMARHLRRQHPSLPLVFAGGVMSNGIIAERLRAALGADVYFAAPALSADNAAGVALLCRAKALKQQ